MRNKFAYLLGMLLGFLFAATRVHAQSCAPTDASRPTIVLIHGAGGDTN